MRTRAFGVAVIAFVLCAVLSISSQLTGPAAINSIGGGAGSAVASPRLGNNGKNTSQPIYWQGRVPTGIGAAKDLPDGSLVTVSQKLVSATIPEGFYVEEADRSAGIRIECDPEFYPPYYPNCLVSFVGIIETVAGERQIRVTSPVIVDSSDVPPTGSLAMKQRAICGGWYEPTTPEGKPAWFLDNTGLLVRSVGRVTASNQFDSKGYFFYLDDGSKLIDGSFCFFDPSQTPFVGTRVYSWTMPREKELKVVTGVASIQVFDPTPEQPNNGDEFPIKTILASNVSDINQIVVPTESVTLSPVFGRVRLADNPEVGVPVRIYSAYDSRVLADVTGNFAVFKLERIPSTGMLVTATAPGYLSSTQVVTAFGPEPVFVLEHSSKCTGIIADKHKLHTCSDDTVQLTTFCRDSEGKPLLSRSLHVTATRGMFTQSGENEVYVNTDREGFAAVNLSSGMSGPGKCIVTVRDADDQDVSASTVIEIIGPAIELTATPDNLTTAGISMIRAVLAEEGTPVIGASLTFATDWGEFVDSSSQSLVVKTDTDGVVELPLRIDGPGTARVLVVSKDRCGNEVFAWVLVGYGDSPWIECASRMSSPLVENLDNSPDGKKEIALVTNDGNLRVWNSDGVLLWLQNARSFGNNTAACANLDGDPENRLELVLPSESECRVRAYDAATGAPLAGWPTFTNYPFINVSAALADVNSDGAMEVLAGDQCCYVFAWNCTGNWEDSQDPSQSAIWRNLTGSTGTGITGSSVAVGDIDNDPKKIPDAIVGTNDPIEVYAFPGDAWGDHVFPPLYVDGWPKDTKMRVESSSAIGDLDGDGLNDMAIGSDDGHLYIYLSGPKTWTGHHVGASVRTSPALGDLDGDGILDVVFGADNGRLYAMTGAGEPLHGWEGGVLTGDVGPVPVIGSPAIGDVTGDGKLEVIVGSPNGYLLCIYNDANAHKDAEGRLTGPIVWAKKCGLPGSTSGIESTPAIDDIDNDGKIDIIVSSLSGVYRIPLDTPYVPTREALPWPTFHGDNARTGCFTAPAPPVYASIIGRVTQNGSPVGGATVTITEANGSPVWVPVPGSNTVRPPVKTVGNAQNNEANSGLFCINQLEPNRTYVITIKNKAGIQRVFSNVTVTTGLLRRDFDITNP